MDKISDVFHSLARDYSTIVTNKFNPIVTIVTNNNPQIVDLLLVECGDLIDSRYKPWFAKRFYKLDKDSIIKAASLARQDGIDSQKYFTDMVRNASLTV